MAMIPYGRQNISEADIQSVVDVLRSDFLTQGPAVPSFEKLIADYCGAEHAVAVNSATSALHIACLSLGLGSGDLLWTSPITFVASANCALYCGAMVDFVDIDPVTYNMSVDRLTEKLEQAKKSGRLPKIVIPVHLCGQSCDMMRIYELSNQYGFKIIEDASHAIGGRYKNKPIGNCVYSDITVFSFHPVKIITTGEGGIATTNDSKLAQKMTLFRSHGITRDSSLITEESHGGWYYQQIELGYNYRMTEMQAALGVSQMTKLHSFIAKRNQLAERYDQHLEKMPITIPYQIKESYSSRHLYVVRLQLEAISLTHKEVFEALRKKNIGVNLHYIPVHTQPYYEKLGFKQGVFMTAEKYYQEAISIPLFHGMTFEQQDIVINELKSILK